MSLSCKVIIGIAWSFCAAIAHAVDHGYAKTTASGSGAVASVNPIATQAGLDAFDKGGNALDAALAVAFTLGVVDSHNSGIGGGCFILVHTKQGQTFAIDGREMAPGLARKDMFLRKGKVVDSLSKDGALAVGIPGSVAALHHLQAMGGALTFADVLYPAAQIAEQGFAIDKVYANRLASHSQQLAAFEASAQIFLDAQGRPKKAGDSIIQKDLARTYRALAKRGPDYFYRGAFADAVGAWMRQNNGIVRATDFEHYQLVLRTPVRTKFNGYDIVGFPPPGSGGVHIAQILNILEQFKLETLTDVDRYHVVIEAMKLAFADRAHWLGDPDFVSVPKNLISKKYGRYLAEKIHLDKASDVEMYSVPEEAAKTLFGKHTTHIATADKEGNWVAITTTLNTSFGSKVIVPGTGVLLNNQMDDFVAQPGTPNAYGLIGAEANSIAAGKRPLSSMSPTIVFKNGKPLLTLGAAGGPTIISQVLQTLVNRLVLGKSLEEAMAMVRVHQQWKPGDVFIDNFAADELTQGLEKKGHKLTILPPMGATQGIAVNKGQLIPVTEPRLISENR